MRRARNTVKKLAQTFGHAVPGVEYNSVYEIRLKRYNRACAMIAADKLGNS